MACLRASLHLSQPLLSSLPACPLCAWTKREKESPEGKQAKRMAHPGISLYLCKPSYLGLGHMTHTPGSLPFPTN